LTFGQRWLETKPICETKLTMKELTWDRPGITIQLHHPTLGRWSFRMRLGFNQLYQRYSASFKKDPYHFTGMRPFASIEKEYPEK
jgi:hypothetical protein